MLDWIYDFYARNNFLTFLWEPHNEHRLIFSKLFTVADIKLFGGMVYPEVVSYFAMWVVAWLMIATGLSKNVPHPLNKWLVCIVSFLFFPTYKLVHIAFAANSPFVFVTFYSFISVVLLTAISSRNLQEPKGKFLVFFSLGLAVCASFSSASGLVIWLVLLASLFKIDISRKHLYVLVGIFLSSFLLVLFSYFYDYAPASRISQAEILSLERILAVLVFIIELLGLPWISAPQLYLFAFCLGGSLLGASIFFLVRIIILIERPKKLEIAAAGMLLFSLLSVVIIAAFRQDPELFRNAHGHRYGIYTLILQISLVVLVAPIISEWLNRKRFKALAVSLSMIIGVVFLVQQVIVGEHTVERARLYSQSSRQILQGNLDRDTHFRIYHNRDKLVEYYKLLREKNIYMFRD